MDATARRLLGLVSEMNVRFVVPVYQRPYSWGIAQCQRLLDDVIACGRDRDRTHFTGSVVTIQDGSVSSQGVVPLLLIDGQQRMATISLLLVALARLAAANPRMARSFSADELVRGGYLTNHYRQGADHYKLTLSKGDRHTLRALVDQLEDPAHDVAEDSARLLRNLAYFERRLQELGALDVVWAGLQRLEVVSVSLAQGQDQPQVIFESMNSTGKDLSSADLVRNYVLMSYPMVEQEEVYRVYWAPIENLLGADAYDAVFDDFVNCYLSVVAPLSHRSGEEDAYQEFKRYVARHGYREGDRMRILVLRLRRFAGYYACVTTGKVGDPQLALALDRIARLAVRQVNPLLLSLFDRNERKALSRAELLEALGLLESYLFRRLVCGCDPELTGPLFASVIARLDAVEQEQGDLLRSLKVALLNETGGPLRFPADAEFALALEGLMKRREVVALDANGAGQALDSGFDALTLVQRDERMRGTDADVAGQACRVWQLPSVSEGELRAHRSREQARAIEGMKTT